jgi:shikimate kinase
MLIFLIGFPGVGKSTLGLELAQLMNFDFVDSDKEISTKENKSIAQILKKDGEEHFRKLESDWLNNYISDKNTIVSCGGGLPCFNNNIEILKSKGKVIHLKSFEDDAIRKIEESPEDYPILDAIPHDKQRSFISDLFRKRSFFYAQADITVFPPQMTLEKLSSILLESLNLNVIPKI